MFYNVGLYNCFDTIIAGLCRAQLYLVTREKEGLEVQVAQEQHLHQLLNTKLQIQAESINNSPGKLDTLTPLHILITLELLDIHHTLRYIHYYSYYTTNYTTHTRYTYIICILITQLIKLYLLLI